MRTHHLHPPYTQTLKSLYVYLSCRNAQQLKWLHPLFMELQKLQLPFHCSISLHVTGALSVEAIHNIYLNSASSFPTTPSPGSSIDSKVKVAPEVANASVHQHAHNKMNDFHADVVTGLHAKTHFGRPNYDAILRGIALSHPQTRIGVFFCGSKRVKRQLKTLCSTSTNSFDFHSV